MRFKLYATSFGDLEKPWECRMDCDGVDFAFAHRMLRYCSNFGFSCILNNVGYGLVLCNESLDFSLTEFPLLYLLYHYLIKL